MDIQTLNAFMVVADEENITKAAEKLHITQPALSRRLMNLEEELGVKLFQRGKHNIRLTEEGLLLRRRSQEMVSLAERTKNELLQSGAELSGEIAIGCNESQSVNELVVMISEFRKEHPLVQFRLQSGNNVEIKEQIERGTIDIGLLIEPVEVIKYDYVRLEQKDEWGILVNEQNELAERNSVRSGEIAGKPLITIMDDVIHRELTMWSGEDAVKMVPIAHYNLLFNAALLVRANEGIAICHRPSCFYDNLRFVPFEPKLSLGAVLVWKGNQKLSKVSSAFINYIKECKKSIDNEKK